MRWWYVEEEEEEYQEEAERRERFYGESQLRRPGLKRRENSLVLSLIN